MNGSRTNSRTEFSRSRNWCFTLNNYSARELQDLRNALDEGRRAENFIGYGIIGFEVADSGTPHLQCYVHFERPRSLAQVKRLPGCARVHAEACKGTPGDNYNYCSKGGEFEEFGNLPQQGRRSDLETVANLVNAGKTIYDIAENCPVEYIKYSKGILSLLHLRCGYRTWKTEVYWYWGSTGTGKSKTAFQQAMEDGSWYAKDPSNQWWDGYNGQEVVVIDDYRRDFCTFSYLLRLLDQYPLIVSVKGSTTQFLAKKIYITTPKNVRETWDSRTEEDLAQLERRITQVVHFAQLQTSTTVN